MDQRARGFTLIETLVVVILMSIILATGVPSFLDLIEKIRTESEAKTIAENLRLARLSAIENKKTVVLCASNDGESCGNNWNDGFLVFLSPDDDTLNAGDTILQKHQFRDSVSVQNKRPNQYRFVFDSNGVTTGYAGSLLVCANAGTNKNGYRVVINRAGRLRLEDSKVTWRNGDNQVLNCS